MSIIIDIANEAKKKQKELTAYNSSENVLLFGTGKSSVIAALSDFTDKPVLALSPAGGSTHLTNEYPNFISYPVANLKELETLINDLEKNMERIRKVGNAYRNDDTKLLKTFEEAFIKQSSDTNKGKEEFQIILDLSKKGEFPISAISVEEADIVSNWVQNLTEKSLNKENLGEDKKSLGGDWNIFKRNIVTFWTRILKLPVKTIIATAEILPSESQNVSKAKPNICTGAGSRLIESMIGNIFYLSEDADKFSCRFLPNNKVFAKQKFKPIKSKIEIQEEIDISGRPEYVWQYMDEIRKKSVELNKKIKQTKQEAK